MSRFDPIVSARVGITVFLAILGARLGWAGSPLPRSDAPEGAAVDFVSPADGDLVKSPFKVQFGLAGMEVAPAGTARREAGHHHLIIDSPLPDPSLPIPSDAHHLHFGGGETETILDLTRGTHTLQLVVGDGNHLPHEPAIVSEQISISVVEMEVRLLPGEEATRYEISVEVPFRMRMEAEPPEDDIEARRARMKENVRLDRLLELLAEEIRSYRRRRDAAQARDLVIEVDEHDPGDAPRPDPWGQK